MSQLYIRLGDEEGRQTVFDNLPIPNKYESWEICNPCKEPIRAVFRRTPEGRRELVAVEAEHYICKDWEMEKANNALAVSVELNRK
jgi:hypothetical protein